MSKIGDAELIENTRAHYEKQYSPLKAHGIKEPKNSILDLCNRIELANTKLQIAVEALKELLEDVTHPDHEAHDWSETVCVRKAIETLIKLEEMEVEK